MKLVITRNQTAKKGLMGGHKGVEFALSYRLVLTSEESELVQSYRLEDYPLTWRTAQGERIPGETIASLVRGGAQTLTDVTTLVANEETIKSACDALPVLFEIVSTFGGEEVIEYPRHSADAQLAA